MVSQVIKDSFLNIYKDDYRDSDNYYKILFNNGRALQQRELNQMQTIINKDIKSFAGYMLDPGAATEGGAIAVLKVPFIRLNLVSNPLPANPTSIENVVFEETSTGIQFRVEKVTAATGIIYVTYIDQAGEVVTDTAISITNTNSTLVAQDGSGVTLSTSATNTLVSPMTGEGLLCIQNPGRFYVDEHFIYSPRQIIILSATSSNADVVVGHKVSESIVTVNDNEDLYDNSGANLNISAPGADRYRITLELTTQDLVDSSDYFIPQIKVADGKVVSDKNAGASGLKATEDFLAIRLREIHGNFTQQNFIITFEDDPNNADAFKVIINPGKAYVGGHRVHLRERLVLTEARPRTTQVINNETTTVTYGNYVVVSGMQSLFDVGSFEKVNIKQSSTTIGTAYVRAIEEFGSNYKIYLFEVKMNAGKNFSSATSIQDSTSNAATIVLENGVARLYGQEDRNLLFGLNRIRPKSFSDIVFTTQKHFAAQTAASNQITVLAGTGKAFDDTGSWIIVNETTDTVVTPTITLSGGGSTAVIGGLTNGESYAVHAYVQHSGTSGSVRTKTLTNRTDSGLSVSGGVVTLSQVDVYSITSVIDNTTSADITNNFKFYNGQTDNYYDYGTLTLKGGAPTPASTVTVTYRHFNWGTSGDFFAASSYTGTIDYEDIPAFRLNNGNTVELREVLDFRPKRSGSTFSGFALPRNGDLITMDVEYYLPVRGRIFITRDEVFGVYFGDPAFDPKLRDLGNDLDTMEIANFYANPYMLNTGDLVLNYTQNKRYTMKEISNIDERLKELKEFTTLSLLELGAVNKNVLDAEGFNRLKTGITADNFKDHFQTDTADEEHRAAIDFIEGVVRPQTTQNSIDLVFDSDLSSGVVKVGDIIILDYDEEVWKNQSSVSRSIPLDDTILKKYQGAITMSPGTDNWKDTKTLPDKVITGNPRIEPKINNTFNYNSVSWQGIKAGDLANAQNGTVVATGTSTSSTTSTGGVTTTKTVGVKGGTNTITTTTAKRETTVTKTPVYKLEGSTYLSESLGEFVRARISIPYMRSRFVSFKATGLRPNTRHFAFFGSTAVDDWVYAATGPSEFTRASDLSRTSDFRKCGPELSNFTQYPFDGGATQIVTDANGTVSGWFLIPNTSSIRFKTGRVTFRLLDISILSDVGATSTASFVYEANGTLEQVQEEVLSTRVYQISTAIDTDTSTKVIPERSNTVFTPNPVPVKVEKESCFVKGTKVKMFDGSEKNIEDIQIFDMLMGQTGPNMVLSYDHWPLGGRDLIGINGSGPFKTPEHPLMTKEGWKAYDSELTQIQKPEIAHLMVNGSLKIGDEIFMGNDTWVRIESLEVHSNEPEQVVYNFYLNGDNTYYANGMLAHNRCGTPPGNPSCHGGGGYTSGPGWSGSDIRLKSDIQYLYNMDDIKIYSFKYLWDTVTKHIGVMAQDLIGTKYANAVATDENGYYKVDYSQLPNIPGRD
jgi:hypothetical protein